MIDYRVLLRKYIRHVVDEEGVSFVPHSMDRYCPFDDEELAELKKLESETRRPTRERG